MSNPFVIHVGDIPNGSLERITTSGPSPVRWGGQMLAVEEGTTVDVDATVNNLGEAFMVQATVFGEANGTCSRCLRPLTPELKVSISEVFGTTPDFIQGDEGEEDEEPPLVVDNAVDISQSIVDEAGLNAPFSPVCEDFDLECEDATPAPDGVSEEQDEEDNRPDPRWAGLEKFKDLKGE